MPDYDETTDPAYRGDDEITARVEEDAATRAELDRDQAAELDHTHAEVPGECRGICDPVTDRPGRFHNYGHPDPYHGNSGPGGPLRPAGDYNRGIAANTMRDNAASRDLPLAEHEARRADELDEDQADELDRPMCSWGVISRGGLATMYGACILPAGHPREAGHLILGTDGRYYRARLR